MTPPQETVWSIEPHTAAKHELLKHYLGAWFPILASRERRIIFLDGFAGPGIYDEGQPGSPIIALRTLLNHSAFPRYSRCEFIFHFIEKDEPRRDRLLTELRQFDPLPSNVRVSTHLGEFQDVIEGVSDSLSSRNRRLAPTLAFVDPFGVSGVPMELISRVPGLAQVRALLDTDGRSLEPVPQRRAHEERSRQPVRHQMISPRSKPHPPGSAYPCWSICTSNSCVTSPSSSMRSASR